MADHQVEEEDIWNYRMTASKKREHPVLTKDVKAKAGCSVEAENKETASYCPAEQDDSVIDVDLEDDFTFRLKSQSNCLSRKNWSNMFSKDKGNDSNESKTKKDTRSIRKRKSIESKSPLRINSKPTKKKENPVHDSKESEKIVGYKNFQSYFSPKKITPVNIEVSDNVECISCSSDENEETAKCSIFSIKDSKAFTLTQETEGSDSNLGSSQGECRGLDSSDMLNIKDGLNFTDSPIETHYSDDDDGSPARTEAKVVDVNVVDDRKNYTAAENENGMIQDDDKWMSDLNFEMCDDYDPNSAGGFIMNDDDESEEEEKPKENRQDHRSDSPAVTDIIPKLSSVENYDSNSNSGSIPTISSKLGEDLRRSDNSDVSAFPSSTSTAAKKQTSLSSFFAIKSSVTSKPKSSDRLGSSSSAQTIFHSSLKKSQTLPPGRSARANPQQQKSSKGIPNISENASETMSASGSKDTKYTGRQRQCPFYKKIPGTNITVDAFRYGTIPGCNVYFLTHFHYDHYGGLTKKFAHPIYCSEVTGNLVERRLGVDKHWVRRLPMWKPLVVDGVTLTLMEANHCPGAVIVLFETSSGKKILHTGDFRASVEMEEYPALKNVVVDELYLDTTYCNPSHAFPSQKTVIDFAISVVRKQMALNPKTLIVCGAYTIGKERIFSAIAQILDSKICVMSDKKKVLDCLDDEDLKKRLTLNWSEGQVHVLPMGKLKPEPLFEHHSRHPRFTSVLAFEPTGWTHTNKSISLDSIRPKWSRNGITLYGVPYSEHSSYLELKRFVQFSRPKKILPTVNNGNPAARANMENIFHLWLTEKPDEEDDGTTPRQTSLDDWMDA